MIRFVPLLHRLVWLMMPAPNQSARLVTPRQALVLSGLPILAPEPTSSCSLLTQLELACANLVTLDVSGCDWPTACDWVTAMMMAGPPPSDCWAALRSISLTGGAELTEGHIFGIIQVGPVNTQSAASVTAHGRVTGRSTASRLLY